MEHFHSDWTLKQITMLHVNAPTDPIFRSMCFNRFKIYLLYFSFVCLFSFNGYKQYNSVSPVLNGTGVLSGLLASPCVLWYGRFILFYIGL